MKNGSDLFTCTALQSIIFGPLLQPCPLINVAHQTLLDVFPVALQTEMDCRNCSIASVPAA
jgi:hypothetical protein